LHHGFTRYSGVIGLNLDPNDLLQFA
jgi:hypothetical protein